MCGMLLGYSFEPRPNSRVLATAGSVMPIGLSVNGCSHSKKKNKKQLTREIKVDKSAATSKVWRDSGRASFSPPHARRQKETLLAGWVRFYLWLEEVQEDIFVWIFFALSAALWYQFHCLSFEIACFYYTFRFESLNLKVKWPKSVKN